MGWKGMMGLGLGLAWLFWVQVGGWWGRGVWGFQLLWGIRACVSEGSEREFGIEFFFQRARWVFPSALVPWFVAFFFVSCNVVPPGRMAFQERLHEW